MSREEYDNLLKLLNEMLTKDNNSLPEDRDSYQPLDLEPLPEYPFKPYFLELSFILESGIFQDGQLKGSQLSGHARKYRSYQIINLEKFIWLLCDKMNSYRAVDSDGRDLYSLSKLLDAIEGCSDTVKRLLGKSEGVQLAAIGEKVRTQLMARKKSLKESSPQFLITERELTEQITNLFKDHIPNAPEKTIYSGVCNFLELFNIKCRPETLVMRDYRRRRRRKAQL